MNCISKFKWERQFQEAYTTFMFKQFENEIQQIWYCDLYHIAAGVDVNNFNFLIYNINFFNI